MSDGWILIGIFLLFGLLALSVGDQGIFGGLATTTPGTQLATSTPLSQNETATQQNTVDETIISAPQENLSNAEIEQRTYQIYQELDRLSEDLRKAKLREPASPFAGLLDLQSGNTYTENADEEYLMLYAQSSNQSPIDVTGWRLESYVTGKSVRIPRGNRVLERESANNDSDIFFEPGDQAYLISGDSPLNADGFHENACTGYLGEENTFYPWLSLNCPSPITEMEHLGNIALDNDACYDFVRNLQQCRTVDSDAIDAADLNNACERFVDHDLTYRGCVDNHQYDPFFDNVGYWWIYLGRNNDLWRTEREIIRLLDASGRVVDVIEY